MEKSAVRQAVVLVPMLIFVLVAASAISLPRLSVEHATNCGTCHINPNGGGMRTEYANREIALGELSLPKTRKIVQENYKPPRINESITYGFDTRYNINDDGRVTRTQIDAYLNVELWSDLFYQFRFDENGIAENYALLNLNNGKHYLKAGRFYPAYGLHIPDHEALIRNRTGFRSRLFLDGLSMGTEISGVNLVAEFFYPDEQRLFIGHLMKTGRSGSFKYMTGTSFRQSEKLNGSNGQWPSSLALFAGLSRGRFTLLGELDLVGRNSDTMITYVSLTTRLEYGAYLVTEYNFFDGDRDVAEGVEEFVRISLELFPVPFVELRPSFTRYTRGYAEIKNDFIVQLHVGL